MQAHRIRALDSTAVEEKLEKLNPAVRRRWQSVAVFVPWLSIVIWLSIHHAMGRDDVRALSLALQGSNVTQMLRAVHGEGHPAIWFLLLRGAHALIPRPQALPVASVFVAAVSALVLLIWSPFSVEMKALILFGHMCLIDYSVVPRDYGIVMLAVFTFVAIYDAHRERDLWPGVVLFLLANGHLLALLLVGGLLLLWLTDIGTGRVVNRRRALMLFAANAAIAAAGVALSIRMSMPTYNDAAEVGHPAGKAFSLFLQAVFLPAQVFRELVFPMPLSLRLSGGLAVFVSLIMYGSLLGLLRRSGAFMAALTTLIGLSGFFVLLSPGGYRHEALWLVMLIAMHWVAKDRRAAQPTNANSERLLTRRLILTGTVLFLLILLIQLPSSIHLMIRTARNGPPYSRSRDLGLLVQAHPELQKAIIIADPDYLVEPLPYYISNPTYLIRENRFGNVVHFTRHARLTLSLGDIVTTARMLHQTTGRPIVILLQHRLDAAATHADTEGYDWELTVTPEDVRNFRQSTKLIRSFVPALTDETFDVYTFGTPTGLGGEIPGDEGSGHSGAGRNQILKLTRGATNVYPG
jgi:hypothetical protein